MVSSVASADRENISRSEESPLSILIQGWRHCQGLSIQIGAPNWSSGISANMRSIVSNLPFDIISDVLRLILVARSELSKKLTPGGIWTHDPQFTRPMLYHLSYWSCTNVRIPGWFLPQHRPIGRYSLGTEVNTKYTKRGVNHSKTSNKNMLDKSCKFGRDSLCD